MIATLKKVEMVMFEKTEMPESVMKKDDKGKTVFEKTGNKIEKTTYTFRDLEGNKYVFMAGNEFRSLERTAVDLELEIKYDDYTRKTKVSLKQVIPSTK